MPLIAGMSLRKAHLCFHLFSPVRCSVGFHLSFVPVSVGIFRGCIYKLLVRYQHDQAALQSLEIVDYVAAKIAAFVVKIMKEILLYLDSLSARQLCLPPAVGRGLNTNNLFPPVSE